MVDSIFFFYNQAVPDMMDQTVFESGLLHVTDVRCRMHRSGPDAVERVDAPRLIFVRRGVFECGFGREGVVADANTVLCLNAGDAFQVSHPCDEGDDCSVLVFPPELFCEAFPGGADETRPFSRRRVLLDSQVQYAQRLFHHRLRGEKGDGLAVEEAATVLIGQLAGQLSGYRLSLTPRSASRSDQVGIEQARVLMAAQPEARISLEEIAARVHYSPFHLARLFHAVTGQTLHRYRLNLRLAQALERLEQGETDLSRLALDLGFDSHSHFSATFKRFYQRTPQQARRELRLADLREMRKNLIAGVSPASYTL